MVPGTGGEKHGPVTVVSVALPALPAAAAGAPRAGLWLHLRAALREDAPHARAGHVEAREALALRAGAVPVILKVRAAPRPARRQPVARAARPPWPSCRRR